MEYDIEFVREPLLTPEGYLNEACVRELQSRILNMPKTYERLAGDAEWTTPHWVFLHDIVGLVIYWSIRNIGGEHERPIMPNVEQVATWLHLQLRPRFNADQMAKLSLCEINKMLHDALDTLSIFREWNDEAIVGPSWLDLDALLHMVCISIRDERRTAAEFDARFEREHGPLMEKS